MEVKVCGLKHQDNVIELVKEKIDFTGFIFYEKSSRFVGDHDLDFLKQLSSTTKKVGVFVNSSIDEVMQICEKYNFDFVQLHGNERAEYCKLLADKGISVIKAFGVDAGFRFKKLEPYLPFCKYFLFDTKSPDYGGTGIRFDWQKLENYPYQLPYLLSGGIAVEMVTELQDFYNRNQYMIGIDINSRFELSPGNKDVEKIRKFLTQLRYGEITSDF